MLTLLRKEAESIVLTYNNDKIIIVLKEAKNGKARISINAPDEVLILREKLEGE